MSTTDDWAMLMFVAFGRNRATEVYETLAEALHPDNGGNEDMFRELCVGYERYQALDIVPAGRSDEKLFGELRDAYQRASAKRDTLGGFE